MPCVGDEIFELIFDFNPPPDPEPPGWEREWNNFEGSVVVAGRYYAVWPSLEANSACLLLLKLRNPPPDGPGAKQYWIYRAAQGGSAYYYPQEVPFPICP